MKKKAKTTDNTAGVRKASRELAIGKGRPGQFNPNRTVRFATPSDKYAARGRSVRSFD